MAVTLEERMSALESDVARIKRQLEDDAMAPRVPWWERRLGAFEGDCLYDEACRLGEEYRRSQPSAADSDVPA
jgi:hypothetical protein